MLPGGDLPKGGLAPWLSELQRRYPALPAPTAARARAAPRHARAGHPGRSEIARPTWARISATASPPPRSNTSCATEWARNADDVLVAADQVRARAATRARARGSRPKSRKRSRQRGDEGDGGHAAAGRDAPGRAPFDSRRVHRHRRHAVDPWHADRRSLRRDGAAARRGEAGDPDHGSTGRLVRPHRPDVAGRRGRRRERSVVHAPRRGHAQARPAIRRRRGNAPREPCAARRDRRRDHRRRPRLRARVRPALPRERSRDRFSRGRGRRCRASRSTGSSR